jgi:hypothetical protein
VALHSIGVAAAARLRLLLGEFRYTPLHRAMASQPGAPDDSTSTMAETTGAKRRRTLQRVTSSEVLQKELDVIPISVCWMTMPSCSFLVIPLCKGAHVSAICHTKGPGSIN